MGTSARSDLLRRRWDQPFELLDEAWEMFLNEVPDERVLHISIFVDQHVSLSHDPAPWDLGMCLLETEADPVRGLADDLERALDGKVPHRGL
jgi:hypothetical protein